MPDDSHWLLTGDFNLIRSIADRNKPGAHIPDILKFNEAISNLGIIEIPLKDIRFTWSNMQDPPLLAILDWFFSLQCWTIKYPETLAYPLARTTSDHTLCVISIKSNILKSRIFCFENFWMKYDDFLPLVESV
jgi:hypothetical protein